MEYVHLEMGQDITALAGYYTPIKELRLKYDGKEVLCVIGTSTVESSCCGGGICGYAIVPGFIVNWKSKTNEDGLAVSEIETIDDKDIQIEITKTIRETEHIQNISFW